MPRRAVIRVALFLLLGAILNIAVAWGCAFLLRPVNPRSELAICNQNLDGTRMTGDAASIAIEWRRMGAHRRFSIWRAVSGGRVGDVELQKYQEFIQGVIRRNIDFVDLLLISGDGSALLQNKKLQTISARSTRSVQFPGYEHEFLFNDSRGWPLLSLECDAAETRNLGDREFSVSGGVIVDSYSGVTRPWLSMRVVPLLPIWPGFAINTLFYAAITWFLFIAPFALRRRMRTKRGLCPACAYPIGVSPVCTECGKPLPKRTGTAS